MTVIWKKIFDYKKEALVDHSREVRYKTWSVLPVSGSLQWMQLGLQGMQDGKATIYLKKGNLQIWFYCKQMNELFSSSVFFIYSGKSIWKIRGLQYFSSEALNICSHTSLFWAYPSAF